MARICSCQRLLSYRCKRLNGSIEVVSRLIGEQPLCSTLRPISKEILELSTSQLTLTSRTIHTPSNPYLSTSEFMPHFTALASVLARELFETTKILTTVLTNVQLLENLEILAVSLRRQGEQLKKMFFTRNFNLITRPALLIKETSGRIFWEREFGQSNCVAYKSFERRLLAQWPIYDLDEKRSLKKVIKFLINFPNDDLVTTYKWDIFLGQWGSFSNLFDNLRLVALRPGFLGPMNGKQAEQMLSSMSADYALIRFSSSSGTLSIAYRSKNRVMHERKPQRVDLRQFLQDTLQNKQLVPMSLQWDKIDELHTLEDCVKLPTLLTGVR